MSSTAVIATGTLRPGSPEAPEPPVEVLGLDATGTATFLAEAKARENAAAADQLRAVTHWADLHPAGGLLHRANGGPLGREGRLALGGAGVAAVAEFAVTEVAAVLGVSEPSARSLVGEGLELRDRLPRLWARVMAGDLPVWRARRIAERTIPLPFEAAAYVDELLASFAHKVSVSRIDAAVTAALLRFDPDSAAEVARRGAEQRRVDRQDHLDGTSTTIAVTDTPDAVALDASLNDYADLLGALGDFDPHQVRRAKALGLLASPQHALDLLAATESVEAADVAGQADGKVLRVPRCPSGSPVLHIHLHQGAVETSLGVARVTGAGLTQPVPVEAVNRWLTELAPGAVVKVTPVVDLTEHISVDAYEHPPSIERQVDERDLVCCFPWCGRKGRYDIDHVESYDFGDPDVGRSPPPGQTSTENSARLCRFHHRVKTHPGAAGPWTYRRHDATTVFWISPLGRGYLVDHTGTQRLN